MWWPPPPPSAPDRGARAQWRRALEAKSHRDLSLHIRVNEPNYRHVAKDYT
jgi:hypothetical protein